MKRKPEPSDTAPRQSMLSKKLGIKPGFAVYAPNSPAAYRRLLSPLPENTRIKRTAAAPVDMIHYFTKSRALLERDIKKLIRLMKQNGMIWVSWPKKAAKTATDVTENTVRSVILPLGLVDVKVCAVDDVWSALKIVIRKENRRSDRHGGSRISLKRGCARYKI